MSHSSSSKRKIKPHFLTSHSPATPPNLSHILKTSFGFGISGQTHARACCHSSLLLTLKLVTSGNRQRHINTAALPERCAGQRLTARPAPRLSLGQGKHNATHPAPLSWAIRSNLLKPRGWRRSLPRPRERAGFPGGRGSRGGLSEAGERQEAAEEERGCLRGAGRHHHGAQPAQGPKRRPGQALPLPLRRAQIGGRALSRAARKRKFRSLQAPLPKDLITLQYPVVLRLLRSTDTK